MRGAISLSVVLAIACGSSPAKDVALVQQVTVPELERATSQLVFFNYIGSDADFHYFTTAHGDRYKVSRPEWELPHTIPLGSGVQMFVSVRNGKLTVPDPEELEGLFQDETRQPPWMEWSIRCVVLLLGGTVAWGLWRAGQPRVVLVVRIGNGEPRAVAGAVTLAFLQQVREMATCHGVNSGRIRGRADGTRIRLEFSRQIPDAGRQQLRNWWSESGWSAGRQRRVRTG
jgi:hypothetical protein